MAKDSFLSAPSMSLENLVKKHVLSQPVYEPGKPIEEVARELGLDPHGIAKLASNESPFGSSPKAVAAVKAWAENAWLYPDGGCYELKNKLAAKRGVVPEQLIIGNGSNEIIELLCHCFLNEQTSLVAAEHAFVVYRLMAKLFGAKYIEVPDPGFIHDLDAMAQAITEDTRLVFIANPNNPTGTMVDGVMIERFLDRIPDHVIAVFDEAYHEFLEEPPDTIGQVRKGKNVCVMRTFSKAQGLAALRIGYGIAPKEIADLLNRARQPFNANAIAQAGALAALGDDEHVSRTVDNNAEGLAFFEKSFDQRGLHYVESKANFVLVEVGDGDAVFAGMLSRGVIVRAMRGYKLPEWVRISVGTKEENERCIEVLDEVLKD